MRDAAELPVRLVERAPADLGALGALVERVFREGFDLPVADRLDQELEEIRLRFDPERDLLLSAEAEGQTVGALFAVHDAAPAPEGARLGWLAVSPRFRQRGLGRALLSHALERFRSTRTPVVRARCFALAPAPARLYWEFGFRVAALATLRIGGRVRETILFEKRLAPPPASA